MMNVVNDHLVIEEKGIYSIEKFLMARRLMYWQVYLHKTVISAEIMLIAVLKRARQLTLSGIQIPSSPELNYFLGLQGEGKNYLEDPAFLQNFVRLDDIDILWLMKKSVDHEDQIFSALCKNLLNRKLLKVKIKNEESYTDFSSLRTQFQEKYHLNDEEIKLFFTEKKEVIYPYDLKSDELKILLKSGKVSPYSALNPYLNKSPEERTFLFYQRGNNMMA